MAEVWQIVEKNLEPLRLAIEAMLSSLDALEREVSGDAEECE